MKNAIVYIGTIKKCLNFEEYQKYGEVKPTLQIDREESKTMAVETHLGEPICVPINTHAVLIQDKDDNFYQFDMNGKLFHKLHLILRYPSYVSNQYYDKNTLVPYYLDQPKRLSLRKLKKDLINDPRIPMGIEH